MAMTSARTHHYRACRSGSQEWDGSWKPEREAVVVSSLVALAQQGVVLADQQRVRRP
jgi:hypothetical protein